MNPTEKFKPKKQNKTQSQKGGHGKKTHRNLVGRSIEGIDVGAIEWVIGMVDRGNGVEYVGREREVAGDEVEGTDEGLGLLDRVESGMALQLSHHGGNSLLDS